MGGGGWAVGGPEEVGEGEDVDIAFGGAGGVFRFEGGTNGEGCPGGGEGTERKGGTKVGVGGICCNIGWGLELGCFSAGEK